MAPTKIVAEATARLLYGSLGYVCKYCNAAVKETYNAQLTDIRSRSMCEKCYQHKLALWHLGLARFEVQGYRGFWSWVNAGSPDS